jgi:hypothetical protein
MPSVSIVGPEGERYGSTINYGDMLHVDFGVTAMGLNTDTQHLAYVLSPGETEKDIPQGLLDGLKKVNRLQDIVKDNMKIGVSGNDILKVCLDQMKSEGFGGKVYSHPIGDWGHSAGTLIGMYHHLVMCMVTYVYRNDQPPGGSRCPWKLAAFG